MMARQEYLIEAMEETGKWYILGSDRLATAAQRYMRNYRRMFPKLPLRVREYPSRKLIVIDDPTDQPSAAPYPHTQGE